jgi:hypothetical protein
MQAFSNINIEKWSPDRYKRGKLTMRDIEKSAKVAQFTDKSNWSLW